MNPSTQFATNHVVRILIVEDDQDSSLFYKTALEDSGFYVHVYNDPLEALSKFKPNFYDLLLIDIRMPKLNGFKLFQMLRKRDVKFMVCFMTAFELYYEAMVENYPSLKDTCFIRKPISKKDLIKIVRKVLLE
ncbi:MAG TPA: response regulator [Nitrososphaeraceae archaeon]